MLRFILLSLFASGLAYADPNTFVSSNGTVFYVTGQNEVCGLATPAHMSQYVAKANPTDLGEQDPSLIGPYLGTCQIPEGTFDDGTTVYFSVGNGAFCGFTTPDELAAFKSVRNVLDYGFVDFDYLSTGMYFIGICQGTVF